MFYIRNTAPLEHSSSVRKTAEKKVGLVSKLSPPVCRYGSTASLPRTTMDRFYIRNTAPLEHSSSVRKTAEKTVGPGNRTGCNILGRLLRGK